MVRKIKVRDGVSREVPCSALKGETVPDSLPAHEIFQARVLEWGAIAFSIFVPWRRTWQPTLVFLPRESHGQRSLAGYSSVAEGSDMT